MAKYEALILLTPESLNNISSILSTELAFAKKQKNFATTYYGMIVKVGSRDKVFGVVNEPVAIPLAYEIKHQAKGVYVMYSFETEDTQNVQEFRKNLLINRNVLRYVVVNLDNEYGASATKNPKKIKTSGIIAAKYAKRRDEFIKSRTASVESNIENIVDQLSDIESFDSEKPIVEGNNEELVVNDASVVKRRKRTTKKNDE
jgi:ribosomal protein S6